MDTRRFPSHRVSLGVQLNQSLRNARNCKSKGSHQETNDNQTTITKPGAILQKPVLSEELKVILTQIALLNRKVFVIRQQIPIRLIIYGRTLKKKKLFTHNQTEQNRTIKEKTLQPVFELRGEWGGPGPPISFKGPPITPQKIYLGGHLVFQ